MPGLTPLAVEFTDGNPDALEFGYLPRVWSDTTPDTLSVSLWIKPNASGTLVAANGGEGGGFLFAISNVSGGNPKLVFFQNVYSDAGQWNSATFATTPANWYHVAGTYDMSSAANDPIFYVNAAVKATTELDAPADVSRFSKQSADIMIGNQRTSISNYIDTFGGQIFDVRIYNRILTPAEITILYNAGTPSMSAGLTLTDNQWVRSAGADALYDRSLVLQSFTVMTERVTQFTDQDLSGLKLRDVTYGYVCGAHGNPIGRAAP